DALIPSGELLRGAQLGGARPLVREALGVARPLGTPREDPQLAGARGLAKDALRPAILARVIREDDDAPARLEEIDRGAEPLLERGDLVVDEDLQRLERAPRRVDAREPRAVRLGHDLRELRRRLDGQAALDEADDLLGVRLVAELAELLRELLRRQ